MRPMGLPGHPANPALCFYTSVQGSPTRRRASPPRRSNSIPLLVIAGDVPSYYEGRGPHQEFNLRTDADQISVYEPFVKRAWRVRRADQVPRILARAWDLALAGRPGPVLVSVPMDVLAEPLEAELVPSSPVDRPALERSDCRRHR